MDRSSEPLQIIVTTVGEASTPEALERLIKYTPKPFNITLWYDTCGRGLNKEFLDKMLSYTDDVVVLYKNHGVNEAHGFHILNAHSEFVIVTNADLKVTEDYYEKLMKPMRDDKRMAASGQSLHLFLTEYELNNKMITPDQIIMYRKEAINDVGGFSPSFRNYGFGSLEWMFRAYLKGWNFCANRNIILHEFNDHEGRNLNPDLDKTVHNNTSVLERLLRKNFCNYNWWSDNL